MRCLIRKKIQLGLRDSYELLSKLPQDPIGQLYLENAKRIINALTIRNNSLFAHGFQPISKNNYQDVSEVIVNFIMSGITLVISPKQKLESPQFPTKLAI